MTYWPSICSNPRSSISPSPATPAPRSQKSAVSAGRTARSGSTPARPTPAKGHRATRIGTIGFQSVPEEVWDFHIGGYQVCHKWLKDRKGRALLDEDLAHYQKIVVALNETIRIMDEIDEVIEAHGGWPDAFHTAQPPPVLPLLCYPAGTAPSTALYCPTAGTA